MALTASQLTKKKARKNALRLSLRNRRYYLLDRYGSFVGHRVYDFERRNIIRKKTKDGTRTIKVLPPMPKELLDDMKRVDRSRQTTPRINPVFRTTGDIHRARRAARKTNKKV